jgi:hypothetical protein
MQSLKACALLPALADIAAWRSHSVASWLTVLGAVMVSLAGGVPAVLLPDGREGCGVAHAAKRRSAANNPSFISHPRFQSFSKKIPLNPSFVKGGFSELITKLLDSGQMTNLRHTPSSWVLLFDIADGIERLERSPCPSLNFKH